MNWDALGALAELAGAIGVIASLLYVAKQVRTGNRASSVQAKLETTRFMTDYGDLLLQNPELDEILTRGIKSYSALPENERRQFVHLALKAFWFFSAGYFQYRQKTLSESDWHELRAIMYYWLQEEGTREWWEIHRTAFGEDFVTFIEGEIAKITSPSWKAVEVG